jgi:hypothetical protein
MPTPARQIIGIRATAYHRPVHLTRLIRQIHSTSI